MTDRAFMKYWLWRSVVVLLALTILSFDSVLPSRASTSTSYRLNGSTEAVESSQSTSYSLCARFGAVSTGGSSASYSLAPALNCAIVTDSGGRRRYCGNGIVEQNEQCDDGNFTNGDGCSDACFLETVGGPSGGGGSSSSVCGNGLLEASEQCDDGNLTNADGCSSSCSIEISPPVTPSGPVCGNGFLESPEQCDDGNSSNGDGCSALCRFEVVPPPVIPEQPDVFEPELPIFPEDGPFYPSAPEEPSLPLPPSLPSFSTVQPPISTYFPGSLFAECGNGVIEVPELCDDGNRRNGDGCSAVCRLESIRPREVSPVESSPLGGLQTYLTNDIETLFFEQFPGGSGHYEILLYDNKKYYLLDILETTPGYFSFHLREDLPDGVYGMTIRDTDSDEVLQKYLIVREQEPISSPQLFDIAGQDVSEDVSSLPLEITDAQPLLHGKTDLSATVAIYSPFLQQTFIVYTDDQNQFEFQYPSPLPSGVFEELHLIAHYENGYVSRPMTLIFSLSGNQHFVAFDREITGGMVFSFLAISMLFAISSLSSLAFFGFFTRGSFILSKNIFSSPNRKKMVRKSFKSLLLIALFFANLFPVKAITTTPNLLPYEGILKTSSGVAISTSHDFRFSIWSDADFNAGVDRDGLGAIPGFAPGYSGYSEVRTIVPDSTGFFQVNVGEINPVPDFNILEHLYLQVEVKSTGGPDTSYETLDIDGIDNLFDRQALGTVPYARNSDFIDNAELGLSQGNIVQLATGDVFPISVIPGGTNADIFALDSDNTGGVVQLSFGDVLNNQILSFDPDGVAVADGWFHFSDDVNIDGDLTVVGTINGVIIGPAAKTIQYQPEYPNVIYEGIGPGGHKGKMEIFYVDEDGPGSPANYNYYKWTTTQLSLQDKDLVIRFRLPDNFVSWQVIPITLSYKTEDNLLANNKVDVSIEDTTGTLIGTLTGNSDLASDTFTTASIGFGGGGVFTAGAEITIFIKMSALDLGAVYVSDLNFHIIEN